MFIRACDLARALRLCGEADEMARECFGSGSDADLQAAVEAYGRVREALLDMLSGSDDAGAAAGWYPWFPREPAGSGEITCGVVSGSGDGL